MTGNYSCARCECECAENDGKLFVDLFLPSIRLARTQRRASLAQATLEYGLLWFWFHQLGQNSIQLQLANLYWFQDSSKCLWPFRGLIMVAPFVVLSKQRDMDH